MCLYKPAKFKTKRQGKFGVGYKVFIKRANPNGFVSLFGEFKTHDDYERYGYPIKQWISDRDGDMLNYDGYYKNGFEVKSKYQAGFHIFNKLPPPALVGGKFVYKKVLYKNILAKGNEMGGDVVVAKNMMILE